MASSPETAVKVSVAPCGLRIGRQPVEIEGELPRRAAAARSVPAAAATNRASALRRTGRPARRPAPRRRRRRGRARSPGSRCTARMARLLLGPVFGPSATRRGTRIPPSRCACVLGAVAVERKLQLGLRRDAQISADRIAELEMQRRLFRRILRRDLQRQDDVIDIADRVAAGAVGKSLRRRPQHGGRFHIVGAGKIEGRRHAGIAGIAPIGLPARIELDLDAGAQHRRSRTSCSSLRRSAAPRLCGCASQSEASCAAATAGTAARPISVTAAIVNRRSMRASALSRAN